MATVTAGMTMSLVASYEFQVPIFVLTHDTPRTPPKQNERLTFTFVTDGAAAAVDRAKAAAGEKTVQVVGGPSVVRELLRVSLERADVRTIGPRTSLAFRVVRNTGR